MHNRQNTRRTGCSSRRRTARGGMAPYPASLYAEQNQPSRAIMEYSTTSDAARPPEAAMRNVARGGSRRKHRRKRSHKRSHKHGKYGKHSKRHTRR